MTDAITYRGLAMPVDFLTEEITAWKIGIDQALSAAPEPVTAYGVITWYAEYNDMGNVLDVYREFPDGVVEYWDYFHEKWRVFGKESTIPSIRSNMALGHALVECGYDVVNQYKETKRKRYV